MTLGDDPGDDMMSTGKLFEYLGARSSILGLVPEGVAKRTIREYGAGVTVHPHDVPAIAEALTSLYDAHRQDRRREHNEEFVRQHDRRQLTGRLVKLFNSLLDIESAHRHFD